MIIDEEKKKRRKNLFPSTKLLFVLLLPFFLFLSFSFLLFLKL